MSNEETVFENDDELLFSEDDWESAGLAAEGPAGFEIVNATIADRESDDNEWQVVDLELDIVEHSNPANTQGKLFTSVSLDPRYIKQFKLLVTEGVGMEVSGAVTRGRLKEIVAALPGTTFYGVIKHKKGFANLGYRFGDSMESLVRRKK